LFRVVDLVLETLRNHKDDYLRRIAIMLFNSIVQGLDNQKREIGYLGAVKVRIDLLNSMCQKQRFSSLFVFMYFLL